MRNLSFIILFIGSALCASAQKVYFVYLQSENARPFYVKMGDKIYSSATLGYLILSNLADSTYNFSVGFPSPNIESRFVVTLRGKDRGFLIKNLESGLGLFDLQTLTIVNAQKESTKAISYQRRNDEFSFLLSRAANDTSLLYVMAKEKEDAAVQKEQAKTKEPKQKDVESALLKDTSDSRPQQTDVTLETKKSDTSTFQSNSDPKKEEVAAALSKEGSKKDTAASEQKDQQIIVSAINSVASNTAAEQTDSLAIAAKEGATAFKRSQVKKHSESSTTEGFGLVFYDIYEGGQDTIRLVIPNPPIVFKQTSEADSSLEPKDYIRVDELKKDTARLPVVVAAKNSGARSECKSLASDNDFFKLRKSMAAKTSDVAMVTEAKKVFKNKCFTTEQIKNLSSLFLTSAGKYQFFDAAYLHVSDKEKFSSLESEIKDEYYLKRFKALTGD